MVRSNEDMTGQQKRQNIRVLIAKCNAGEFDRSKTAFEKGPATTLGLV
jgi:hypothetical protein